jgi:hypothetical protein
MLAVENLYHHKAQRRKLAAMSIPFGAALAAFTALVLGIFYARNRRAQA